MARSGWAARRGRRGTAVSRRQALARLGLGVSVAYAAPVLSTLSIVRSSRSGRGAVALAGENAPAAAGGEIGRTTVVVRKVTGALAGEVCPLAPKESVHRDEVIETAVSSASQIVFRDHTKVSLGPNTRLTLDEFVFDPDPAHGRCARR